MPRTFSLLLTLATLSAGALAQTGQVGQNATPNTIQSQPAPIVRNSPQAMWPRVTTTQPVAGVWLQTDQNSTVKTISADANKTEIRIDRGRANVQVHHPAGNSQILVDLPGGQTTLLKDGLYTFNAETNTVRVLRGEAEVYPGTSNSTAKPVKVKEAPVTATARMATGTPRTVMATRIRTRLTVGGIRTATDMDSASDSATTAASAVGSANRSI